MTPQQIINARDGGLTWGQLAARLGVHPWTARRYYARAVAGEPIEGRPRGGYRTRAVPACDVCGEPVDTRRGGAGGLCARHYQARRRAHQNK